MTCPPALRRVSRRDLEFLADPEQLSPAKVVRLHDPLRTGPVPEGD